MHEKHDNSSSRRHQWNRFAPDYPSLHLSDARVFSQVCQAVSQALQPTRLHRRYPSPMDLIDEDAVLRFAQLCADATAVNDAALASDFDEARSALVGYSTSRWKWGGTLSHRRLAKSNNSLGRLERNRSLDTGPKCCSWLSS